MSGRRALRAAAVIDALGLLLLAVSVGGLVFTAFGLSQAPQAAVFPLISSGVGLWVGAMLCAHGGSRLPAVNAFVGASLVAALAQATLSGGPLYGLLGTLAQQLAWPFTVAFVAAHPSLRAHGRACSGSEGHRLRRPLGVLTALHELGVLMGASWIAVALGGAPASVVAALFAGRAVLGLGLARRLGAADQAVVPARAWFALCALGAVLGVGVLWAEPEWLPWVLASVVWPSVVGWRLTRITLQPMECAQPGSVVLGLVLLAAGLHGAAVVLGTGQLLHCGLGGCLALGGGLLLTGRRMGRIVAPLASFAVAAVNVQARLPHPSPAPTPNEVPSISTPASAAAGPAALVARGSGLFVVHQCAECHSLDGTASVGPTIKGLAGRMVTLTDGRTLQADSAYLFRSLTDPGADVPVGYPPSMASYADHLKGVDLAAVVLFMESVR